MKRNNYLLGFAGILIFLVVGNFFVVYKYFQILVHHSIYYCQEMMKYLSLGSPGNLGKAVFGFLALAFLFTLFRLFSTLYKIYSFKKTLTEAKNRERVRLTQLLDKLYLKDKVKIIEENKPQAFCFGVLDPKIYISTGLLKLMNKQELEVILAHEKYHIENSDLLTMLLATMVESLFPFFPILSDFIKIYRIDREVKADRAAINQISDEKSLTLALKKLLQYEPTVNPAFVSGINSINTLEFRIQSLLSLKTSYKTIGRKKLFVSFISMATLVGLVITPVKTIELHRDGRDVMMVDNCG